jgi:histidyl-tRNA synthetase
MEIKAPKGTRDLLPSQSYEWKYVESVFDEVCQNFGYKEVRTPTFEHTELFSRGVGDTTDVVEKQMYTFLDKAGRSVTLRPEGTSPVVRSFLEHHLYAEALPAKMYYNIPCFRYEKPQAGRLREFHQFGVEAFGSEHPTIDAEIISLAVVFLERLGLSNLEVSLNSIGCPVCRKKYNEVLREYFRPHLDELCDTCRGRFERNPLRILDCKSETCQAIAKDAPVLLDYICDDCKTHFETVKSLLTQMEIQYKIDSGIVRGLDYYTKTVFEIVSEHIGAKSTVCGGGRYDGLVEELGGNPVPGIGFGLGIERLLLTLEANGVKIPKQKTTDVFLVSLGEKAASYVPKLAFDLRRQQISVDTDHMGRGLKAQMKYADKMNCRYTAVIGDNEIDAGQIELKNMETGEKYLLQIENIAEFFEGETQWKR